MARFFSEQEIDSFRDCFYLNCKTGTISEVDQLKLVMRSSGFSPTESELRKYLSQRNNSVKFADFLDCAHSHLQTERVPDEILDAFRVSPFVDTKTKNIIPVDTLRHIMCNWGEKMSHKEFNSLTRELNLNKPEVSCKQLVSSLAIPTSTSKQQHTKSSM